MRIVIDLQGAQSTGSRNRGIGRYSMSLSKAIIKNRNDHEILLVLSDLFPESVEPILTSLEGLLPRENIRLWTAPGPVGSLDQSNDWRRGAAELTRETFLASLDADFVLVTSLFEGLGDDSVTSVGLVKNGPPTAVILFDLIPFIHRSPYLDNPEVAKWYLEKIEHLRRADLCLAISESSQREGKQYLLLPEDGCISISSDAEPHFKPIDISEVRERELRDRYSLDRPFLMYTGGIDHRKNIEGLIAAFANLPPAVRTAHRLAIVCSVQATDRAKLEAVAQKAGLTSGEVIMTGFVPEDDLLALYNLCSAFVFPSWHEGFGLPVLEAMRCGAPVIGANTSSIPEVIGLPEALFDPHSQREMTESIHRVLTDESFRNRLRLHGPVQSKRFSWDRSAKTAIVAMERLHQKYRHLHSKPIHIDNERPHLAFVSPLPPAKSGIADYSTGLIRVLTKYYRIDVIVDTADITDTWILEHCAIKSPEWLLANARDYDRVLYHFGNSHFHQYMFPLLEKVPGVVVLHDFFLSDIIAHIGFTGNDSGILSRELYRSHGYHALLQRWLSADGGNVVETYPCSAGVVGGGIGIIVHSSSTMRLASNWYGDIGKNWAVIPLLREAETTSSKSDARSKLGLDQDSFLVCSFGKVGPMKQSLRLFEAWQKSSLSQDTRCHLIFVGENDSGPYGRELDATISGSGLSKKVHVTGWVDANNFRDHLNAADLAVQLRTRSRGETSAAVLDCMKHGLPTIVNANGSMADLDDRGVLKLPDAFTDDQLVQALEQLWSGPHLREELGTIGRGIIFREHDPVHCAELYRDSIEKFYAAHSTGWRALPSLISALPVSPSDDRQMIRLADAIGQTFPSLPRKRQLLVDISTLAKFDSKTGIQRVVRSILEQWLGKDFTGLRIEPVYATEGGQYRYARQFTCGFLGCPDGFLDDDVAEFGPGDVFFGLDLHPQVVTSNAEFYRQLRRNGVRVVFAVYDLLCMRMPQYFPEGSYEAFRQWLLVIAESDKAICISQAVASDLQSWIEDNVPHRIGRIAISSFQLGADLNVVRRLGSHSSEVIEILGRAPSFLMVGTIEPRKGHKQVLAAFEELWDRGKDVNLVIVGKHGWRMEETLQYLKSHPRQGKCLFWLEGISDEYLEHIYASSNCLLAASEGEGYGLPLIEAARHGLPILARDLAVFREVVGDNAIYFDSFDPNDLADAIERWLELFENGAIRSSEDVTWLSWSDSASQLMRVVIDLPLTLLPGANPAEV